MIPLLPSGRFPWKHPGGKARLVYEDPSGLAGEITRVRVTTHSKGHARLVVEGKGPNLGLVTPMEISVCNDLGICISNSRVETVTNTGTVLRARQSGCAKKGVAAAGAPGLSLPFLLAMRSRPAGRGNARAGTTAWNLSRRGYIASSRSRKHGIPPAPAYTRSLQSASILLRFRGVGKKSLTIGQLAQGAGVPTSTVRYYERAKLLRPSARSASNYRLYSSEDLQRLRFIRAAQATGFTLDDVSQLLRPAPCGRVQILIEQRLDHLAERMKDLRHVQRVLRGSLATCQEHEVSGRCRVIDSISASARGRSPGK